MGHQTLFLSTTKDRTQIVNTLCSKHSRLYIATSSGKIRSSPQDTIDDAQHILLTEADTVYTDKWEHFQMMNQIRQKTHLCVPTDFGVQLLFTHGFSACPNIKYEEKFHPCRAYMSHYTKNLDFNRLDLLDVEQSRWQDALYKEIKDIIIRLSVAIYTDASRHVVYVMEDANRYFAQKCTYYHLELRRTKAKGAK